jgi:hypothetical protein
MVPDRITNLWMKPCEQSKVSNKTTYYLDVVYCLRQFLPILVITKAMQVSGKTRVFIFRYWEVFM